MSQNLPAVRNTNDGLNQRLEWSNALASSSLLPRAYQGSPGNLLVAAEYADSLGISRISALTAIHVIDGKPTASADLIAALVRQAGHKLRVVSSDTSATATIIRRDDPDFEFTVTWDVKRADTAGLWRKRGPWVNFPGAMLRSRAITEVARMSCSDCLFGVIYTPEELGAAVDSDGTPVVTAERLPMSAAAGQPVHGGTVEDAPQRLEPAKGYCFAIHAKGAFLEACGGDKELAGREWAAAGLPEDNEAHVHIATVQGHIDRLKAAAAPAAATPAPVTVDAAAAEEVVEAFLEPLADYTPTVVTVAMPNPFAVDDAPAAA